MQHEKHNEPQKIFIIRKVKQRAYYLPRKKLFEINYNVDIRCYVEPYTYISDASIWLL